MVKSCVQITENLKQLLVQLHLLRIPKLWIKIAILIQTLRWWMGFYLLSRSLIMNFHLKLILYTVLLLVMMGKQNLRRTNWMHLMSKILNLRNSFAPWMGTVDSCPTKERTAFLDSR